MNAGTELLRRGEYAYEFMVIENGQAEVTRDGQHVAYLGPGDFLGEIAALERGTRNASVAARSPMCLIVVTARDLRQLAASIAELGERLRATAHERRPLTHTGSPRRRVRDAFSQRAKCSGCRANSAAH